VNTRNLLLIACAILLARPGQAQRVNVIGHRGASTLAPENTLASFKKAIDLGVDFLELDVWNSLDDSLMVIHDQTIDRTTNGTGMVPGMYFSVLRHYSAGAWFSPAFASERIPTLREVLALAKQYNMKSAPEIKNKNVTTEIVALIDSMGMSGTVIVTSFYLDALIRVKQLDPSIRVLYYVDPVTTQAIDTLAAIGGSVIGSGSGNTQAMIDYTHSKGLEFWPWTIDSTTDMLKYMSQHVDAIITNYPQVLIPLRDSLMALSVETNLRETPGRLSLSAYPNPFNTTTVVSGQLSVVSDLQLTVYDLLGRKVAPLMDASHHPAGTFRVTFNASGLPTGMYIVRLTIPERTASLKCLYVK
jgi:glycerophosphoryl diester phosphodiesterase